MRYFCTHSGCLMASRPKTLDLPAFKGQVGPVDDSQLEAWGIVPEDRVAQAGLTTEQAQAARLALLDDDYQKARASGWQVPEAFGDFKLKAQDVDEGKFTSLSLNVIILQTSGADPDVITTQFSDYNDTLRELTLNQFMGLINAYATGLKTWFATHKTARAAIIAAPTAPEKLAVTYSFNN